MKHAIKKYYDKTKLKKNRVLIEPLGILLIFP